MCWLMLSMPKRCSCLKPEGSAAMARNETVPSSSLPARSLRGTWKRTSAIAAPTVPPPK